MYAVPCVHSVSEPAPLYTNLSVDDSVTGLQPDLGVLNDAPKHIHLFIFDTGFRLGSGLTCFVELIE